MRLSDTTVPPRAHTVDVVDLGVLLPKSEFKMHSITRVDIKCSNGKLMMRIRE